MPFENYRCQGAIFDVLQENPDSLLIVVEICALDHFIASQKGNQTGLIDNELPILLSETFDLLKCEKLFVFDALDKEDIALSAFSNRPYNPVVLARISLFYLDGVRDYGFDLRVRPQTLDLFFLLC